MDAGPEMAQSRVLPRRLPPVVAPGIALSRVSLFFATSSLCKPGQSMYDCTCGRLHKRCALNFTRSHSEQQQLSMRTGGLWCGKKKMKALLHRS